MITSLITSVLFGIGKGALKAHAGGIGASLAGVILGPGISGFARGVGGSVEEAGAMIGAALGAYLLGFVVTWFSPKNKADK